MKKHKYNIFPEAKQEDYERLRDDIRANGFDHKQPITIYQGEILDGWNRFKACQEIGIKNPPTVTFTGSDSDAIALVMRTNKRRNLNSGQWATVAVEAEEVMAAIRDAVERERRERQAETRKKSEHLSDNKLSDKPKDHHEAATAHKVAAAFNTNRTYVNQAAKMKQAAPEVFEKVKAGKMTMQDANKAVRAIPTNPWLPDEEERKAMVESGKTVVANSERDKNLIQWAEKKGIAVRVDRSSKYGNPFILDDDGDRDAVCDAYENHYLPHKPSIKKQSAFFKAKVLICHCYPKRCHAESLAKLVE